MKTITTDIVVIAYSGAGLRTAIAAAEANPDLDIALILRLPYALTYSGGRGWLSSSYQG